MITCVCTHSGDHSDEELGAIGIRSSIGHADSVRTVMLEGWMEFIFKLPTPY